MSRSLHSLLGGPSQSDKKIAYICHVSLCVHPPMALLRFVADLVDCRSSRCSWELGTLTKYAALLMHNFAICYLYKILACYRRKNKFCKKSSSRAFQGFITREDKIRTLLVYLWRTPRSNRCSLMAVMMIHVFYSTPRFTVTS